MLACYALIEQKGRGVVYYGSARLKQSSPHWARAVELGREVANLLGCTTWSGGWGGAPEPLCIARLMARLPLPAQRGRKGLAQPPYLFLSISARAGQHPMSPRAQPSCPPV